MSGLTDIVHDLADVLLFLRRPNARWRAQAIVDLRIAWQKTLPQAKGSTTKTNRTMLMPPQCYNEVKVSPRGNISAGGFRARHPLSE